MRNGTGSHKFEQKKYERKKERNLIKFRNETKLRKEEMKFKKTLKRNEETKIKRLEKKMEKERKERKKEGRT